VAELLWQFLSLCVILWPAEHCAVLFLRRGRTGPGSTGGSMFTLPVAGTALTWWTSICIPAVWQRRSSCWPWRASWRPHLAGRGAAAVSFALHPIMAPGHLFCFILTMTLSDPVRASVLRLAAKSNTGKPPRGRGCSAA